MGEDGNKTLRFNGQVEDRFKGEKLCKFHMDYLDYFIKKNDEYGYMKKSIKTVNKVEAVSKLTVRLKRSYFCL